MPKGKGTARASSRAPSSDLAAQTSRPSTRSPPHMFQLSCLLYGSKPADNSIFFVDVSPGDRITTVRERIWKKLSPDGVRAFELTLYTPISAISTSDGDTFESAIAEVDLGTQEGLALFKRLRPIETVLESGFSEPTNNDLHILVLVPRVGKRKQEFADIGDPLGSWQPKRSKGELPGVDQLAQIANSPLTEEEKIPIPDRWMNSLVSEMVDFCTLDDVRLLFRLGEGQIPLSQKFFYAIIHPPPDGDTEDLFHHFWDLNVRDMLESLLPDGKSMRNSNRHTATKFLRPDYAFILQDICPIRGEEKPPRSTGNPKAELAAKLAWAYNPAPYVFGYYAIGPDFTLAAITPPMQGRTLPVVHDIASANLRLRKERIKNMCRLIKLSPFIRTLATLVPSSDAEFQVLERDNGTIEVAGHGVVKKYTKRDKHQRIDHLKKVYHLLDENKVPNVDKLKTTFDSTAVIFPRGISKPPETQKELLRALVLHQIPLFHRDIQWPNVMRSLDDPQKWFIIDWDEASVPPTTAQSHLNHRYHSPSVFSDGHGAEVDIWGVGELILRSEALDVSSELRALGQRMKDSIMTAQEALDEIDRLTTV